jgi:hypothetical protein
MSTLELNCKMSAPLLKSSHFVPVLLSIALEGSSPDGLLPPGLVALVTLRRVDR